LAIQLFKKKLPEVLLTTDLALKICEMYGETKNNERGWGLIKFSWFQQYIAEHT